MSARETNLETLLRELKDAHLLFDNDRRERYAAVTTDRRSDWWVVHHVATFPTFEEACAHVGDQLLDGHGMDAVYDLDTADRIELHVSTPVVTRAEEQGILINVLRPDED